MTPTTNVGANADAELEEHASGIVAKSRELQKHLCRRATSTLTVGGFPLGLSSDTGVGGSWHGNATVYTAEGVQTIKTGGDKILKMSESRVALHGARSDWQLDGGELKRASGKFVDVVVDRKVAVSVDEVEG